MKAQRATAAAMSAVLLVSGCATSSKDIVGAYVSPTQYQSYDCGQLTEEANRIRIRVSQLGGRLDEAASNDKAIVGVGLVLFWPALFFLGGTKQQEAEYARLRGEYDALEQAAIQKRCTSAPGTASAAAAATPATTATGTSSDAPASAEAAATSRSSGATAESPIARLPVTTGRLDIATGPGRLTDGILSTGRITLELGASGWVLVERNELPISIKPPLSSSPRLTGTTLRGVAAEISDSRLERVVELTANQAPVYGANDWSEEPCKLPDLLWTETYVRGFELPECIYVRKIRDFDRLAGEGGLGAATAFAGRLGVKPGSAYYEITYARYVFSNFMRISVYLPEARLQGDASAVAWAQRWAPAAKSLAKGNGAVPLPR